MCAKLDNDDAVPYFLWNEDTTLRQFREIIADKEEPDWGIYSARLLREGRVDDVWRFLTPEDIALHWSEISPHLGHRRRFWRFLLDVWKQHGVL